MLPALPAMAGIGTQILGGLAGGRSAKKAAKQQQQGIESAKYLVQGATDQAVASINAPVDQALTMNRPYSDSGIGAMANVNAMLGIGNGGSTAAADLDRMQGQIDSADKRRARLEAERDELEEVLNKSGDYWDRDKFGHGKYKGKTREELANKLEIRKQNLKTLDVEYKGLQRNFQESQRQNQLTTAAGESAQGLQPIRPFQFSGENFDQDPSYQFRMNQGVEALNRSFAARGGLGSGARMMGITEFAQGLASTEYANAFNRSLSEWKSQFDVLNANLRAADMGQAATGTNINVLNNAGTNSANALMQGAGTMAGLYAGGGSAAAAGTIGQNNAYQQAAGGIAQLIGAGAANGWFTNQQQQPTMVDPYSEGGEMYGIPDIQLGR